MLFVQYPKCSTCQKAKKWLDANKITYADRNIKEENPTYDEIKEWHRRVVFHSKNSLIPVGCFTGK